jgi:hypothetical protein
VNPWTIGLVALIVVGLGVIVFGALWDRARNKRRAAQMLAPPPRTIPQFHPGTPAPQYLSELQARRPPSRQPADPAPGLTAAERSAIQAQIAAAETVTIKAGYASRDFVTDPTTSWAVLDKPSIFVCADPVESVRELLSVLDKTVARQVPLVIVAPQVAPDVLATLEVNVIQRKVRAVVVSCGQPALGDVAQASGAVAQHRSDRQSGYLPDDQLGHCERWVSTKSASHLVSPVDVEQRT